MIKLTKLNNEHFVINGAQIECIESIPDTKVIMMNREFFMLVIVITPLILLEHRKE